MARHTGIYYCVNPEEHSCPVGNIPYTRTHTHTPPPHTYTHLPCGSVGLPIPASLTLAMIGARIAGIQAETSRIFL